MTKLGEWIIQLTDFWTKVHSKDGINEKNEAKAPHDLQQQDWLKKANLLFMFCELADLDCVQAMQVDENREQHVTTAAQLAVRWYARQKKPSGV